MSYNIDDIHNEEDLKQFLFHSMRLWDKHLPNYHLKIGFESEIISLDEVEAFVIALQDQLTREDLGQLLLYGMDENLRRGDFYIRCKSPDQIKTVFEALRPLIESQNSFQIAVVSFRIPTEEGCYSSDSEFIRSEIAPYEEDVQAELPTPKGYEETTSGNGCLPQLILIVLTATSLSLFLL